MISPPPSGRFGLRRPDDGERRVVEIRIDSEVLGPRLVVELPAIVAAGHRDVREAARAAPRSVSSQLLPRGRSGSICSEPAGRPKLTLVVAPISLNWSCRSRRPPGRCRPGRSRCACSTGRPADSATTSARARSPRRNLPIDVLSAVLPLPNRSNDAPARIDQSFQHGWQDLPGTLRAGTNGIGRRRLVRVRRVEVVEAGAAEERQAVLASIDPARRRRSRRSSVVEPRHRRVAHGDRVHRHGALFTNVSMDMFARLSRRFVESPHSWFTPTLRLCEPVTYDSLALQCSTPCSGSLR